MNTYLIVTNHNYESTSTDLTPLLPPTSDPIQDVLSFRSLSPTEAALVSELQTRVGPAWKAHSQSKAVLHRTVVQTFEALREDNRFIYIKGFIDKCQSAIASELGISKGYYSQLKKAVAFYQELEATEAPHCLELYQAMATGAQYVFATLPKETRDKLFHKYLCKKEVPSQDTLQEIRASLNAWKKRDAEPSEKFKALNAEVEECPEDEVIALFQEPFTPVETDENFNPIQPAEKFKALNPQPPLPQTQPSAVDVVAISSVSEPPTPHTSNSTVTFVIDSTEDALWAHIKVQIKPLVLHTKNKKLLEGMDVVLSQKVSELIKARLQELGDGNG